MSQQLIDHSADLRQLRDEGYDVDVQNGYLFVRNVPYVNSDNIVKSGTLICKLNLSGNRTNKPSTHVAYWVGEHPCNSKGARIASIEHSHINRDIGNGVKVDFQFSAKPQGGYRDYYHQVTTYIGRITGEATKFDSNATARTFPLIIDDGNSTVFNYVDTASSRADTVSISNKLSGLCIGIIGLGGTGSYVLDMVAKTWVKEIHLFDNDTFSQHNAFRAPGAPSCEELQKKPLKVERFAEIYSNMHRGIIPHDVFISEANTNLLNGLDFIFVCVDRGDVKEPICNWLVENHLPFVDVGMGILVNDGQLVGNVRTVISTNENRDSASSHILYDDIDDEYETNIQIAELNALNATIAVIRWKTFYGIFPDFGIPSYTGYSLVSGDFVTEGS